MSGTKTINIAEAVDRIFNDIELQTRSRYNDEEGAQKSNLRWWTPSDYNADWIKVGDSFFENGRWHEFSIYSNYGTVESKMYRNWEVFPDLYEHLVDENIARYFLDRGWT